MNEKKIVLFILTENISLPIGHNHIFVAIYGALYAIHMKSLFCVPFFPFKWIAKHTFECICIAGFPSFASRKLFFFFCEFSDFWNDNRNPISIVLWKPYYLQSFEFKSIPVCYLSNSNLEYVNGNWAIIQDFDDLNWIDEMNDITIFSVTCHRSKFVSYFPFGLDFFEMKIEYIFFIWKHISFSDSEPFTFSSYSIGVAKKRNWNPNETQSEHEFLLKFMSLWRKRKRMQPKCNLARWIFFYGKTTTTTTMIPVSCLYVCVTILIFIIHVERVISRKIWNTVK